MDALFYIDTQGDENNLIEQEQHPAAIMHQKQAPEEEQPGTAVAQEDVTSMLEARVLHFARDAPDDCILAFPPALSSADRVLLELLAESLHLKHYTSGRGKLRKIIIYKSAGSVAQSEPRRRKVQRKRPRSIDDRKDDELGQPWWMSPEAPSEDDDSSNMLAPGRTRRRAGSSHAVCEKSREALGAPPESAPALPLDTSHRGHQLLVRLGWIPGDGLGAASSGALEPLAAYLPTQMTKQGLGSRAV